MLNHNTILVIFQVFHNATEPYQPRKKKEISDEKITLEKLEESESQKCYLKFIDTYIGKCFSCTH